MLPSSETNETIIPPPGSDFEEQIVEEIPTGEVTLPLPTEPAVVRLARLHVKARALEQIPGVYLLKDTRDVVIYVGKSRSLRDRVSSYFLASTDLGQVKQRLLEYVVDFDTLACDSEVEALLIESRLIKDLHPRFNARMSDGKSYPYVEITTHEDFPGVYITRKPQAGGTKLYGPFTSGYALKQAVIYMQRAFKFRSCHLEIYAGDNQRRFFRPCLLYAIKQCTAPCADKISREQYLENIARFQKFLESSRGVALKEMTTEMEAASARLEFEKAAQLRDQIKALRALGQRGKGARVMQPELFFQDHQAGVRQLQEVLELEEPVRSLEAIDIAHFQGEATVGSLVCFLDGKPFKNGYKRFRIKTVTGIDDFRCIQEVVSRRYREAGLGHELYPDVILIDGGLGQLHAAQAALAPMAVKPPTVISLAKREEEIYRSGQIQPCKLPRTSAALKLLQFARDEAHRFAQNYHHLLIARRQFQDTLRGSAKTLKARPRSSAAAEPRTPAE
ncbi:MAG: UvrB/UvrC motif-containing protein [Phycisphaerae bacterium]